MTLTVVADFLPPEVCEDYVFTRVCQSFTGGGGGIPACIAGFCTRGGGGIPACIAGLQAHTWGVSRPTPGMSPGQQMGGGVGIPACTEASTPPLPQADGYCCGRYASYWNAFLFFFFFSLSWHFESLVVKYRDSTLFLLAVADPGFPRGGSANPPGGGANIRFWQIFRKTAWNWKKNLDPRGRACVPHAPSDPPLINTGLNEGAANSRLLSNSRETTF